MPRYPYMEAADRDRIQDEKPWEERRVPKTVYELLSRTAAAHGDRPAFSFQITSSRKLRKGSRTLSLVVTWIKAC